MQVQICCWDTAPSKPLTQCCQSRCLNFLKTRNGVRVRQGSYLGSSSLNLCPALPTTHTPAFVFAPQPLTAFLSTPLVPLGGGGGGLLQCTEPATISSTLPDGLETAGSLPSLPHMHDEKALAFPSFHTLILSQERAPELVLFC